MHHEIPLSVQWFCLPQLSLTWNDKISHVFITIIDNMNWTLGVGLLAVRTNNVWLRETPRAIGMIDTGFRIQITYCLV